MLNGQNPLSVTKIMSTAPYPAVSNLYWAIPEKKKKNRWEGGWRVENMEFPGVNQKATWNFQG